MDQKDYNRQLIEEYRANRGKAGGPFERDLQGYRHCYQRCGAGTNMGQYYRTISFFHRSPGENNSSDSSDHIGKTRRLESIKTRDKHERATSCWWPAHACLSS
jgi:hypothetical protein